MHCSLHQGRLSPPLTPTFSMVHLLHRLHGVDAPGLHSAAAARGWSERELLCRRRRRWWCYTTAVSTTAVTSRHELFCSTAARRERSVWRHRRNESDIWRRRRPLLLRRSGHDFLYELCKVRIGNTAFNATQSVFLQQTNTRILILYFCPSVYPMLILAETTLYVKLFYTVW